MNNWPVPQEGGAVLVVDDDPTIRSTLSRFLSRLGYRVATAASGEEALAKLSAGSFDLLITDLQMPRSSGLDLLAEVRSRAPATRTMLMSGRAEVTDAAAAVRHGIDRLLLKPFDFDDLKTAVQDSFRESRHRRNAIRERDRLAAEVRQREEESKRWVLRSVHSLTAAVEVKDTYTAGHASRVTAYAAKIATVVGGMDVPKLRLAGDLHDVGKIGVPDAVLNKWGPLTDDELALVRKHPEMGERILQPLLDETLVLEVVRWHHERWDGQGYPDGLRGDRIPLAARVLAVADTLDAMTSSRAYRDALPWDTAIAEICSCSGTQFDPGVVKAFERALPDLRRLFVNSQSAFQGPGVKRDRGRG